MTGTRRGILVLGASGVFGRRFLECTFWDLAVPFTLAGRRAGPLRRVARWLGDRERARCLPLDARDVQAFEAACREHALVACTAGPYSALPRELPAAAVRAGAHWLDISDDREWVTGLLADRSLHDAAVAAGVSVAPGCSTVPGISGVLLRHCRALLPEAERARVTLYIGNRNRKGAGSIARALVSGSTARTTVELPFGPRTAFRFDSPDAPLWKEELAMQADFCVAFQLRLGYRLMARFGRPGCAGLLARLTAPLGFFGDRRGCLQVEVEAANGRRAAAWVIGRDQRMPVIPAAIVADACLTQSMAGFAPGLVRFWQTQPPENWIAAFRSRGLELGERGP